jgi:hypothetical protein
MNISSAKEPPMKMNLSSELRVRGKKKGQGKEEGSGLHSTQKRNSLI